MIDTDTNRIAITPVDLPEVLGFKANIFGLVVQRIAHLQDQIVRDQLIAAGWTPPGKPAPEPVEMSPEFTDTPRAALLWVLWHHQGGSSPVGQPIRFALGMGRHEPLNEYQIAEAKRWGQLHQSNSRDPAWPPPPRVK